MIFPSYHVIDLICGRHRTILISVHFYKNKSQLQSEKNASRKKKSIQKKYVLQREMNIRILMGFWERLLWKNPQHWEADSKESRLWGKRIHSHRICVLREGQEIWRCLKKDNAILGDKDDRDGQRAWLGERAASLPWYTAAAASIVSRCRRAFLFQAQLLSPIPKNTLEVWDDSATPEQLNGPDLIFSRPTEYLSPHLWQSRKINNLLLLSDHSQWPAGKATWSFWVVRQVKFQEASPISTLFLAAGDYGKSAGPKQGHRPCTRVIRSWQGSF